MIVDYTAKVPTSVISAYDSSARNAVCTTIMNAAYSGADIVEELKPFLTVWNFGIIKEYRRKKIGTKMFDYIYKFAKDNNCAFISLIAETNNEVAQCFYESLGYIKEVGYVKLIDKEKW